MQIFCWTKTKKKKPINIDDIVNYACSIACDMLMADVFGYVNDFIEYNGWYFKYRTSTNKSYDMELIVEIKHSIDNMTYNSSDTHHEDCVVCTETTKDLIICCKQAICKPCLKKIQKLNSENFCCPMCRKDLNSLNTKYILTKEEVKKRI